MVSTRGHPSTFPEASTPGSRSTAKPTSTPNLSKSLSALSPTSSAPSPISRGWAHTPSNLTLLWLAISLPLVIWDSGYVLLRPYSMPGGSLHSPIWTPYALYGTIDYVYGFRALEMRNGFTAAQGTLNVIETIGYFWYLYIVYKHGVEVDVKGAKGRGASKKMAEGKTGSLFARLARPRVVGGREAGLAVIVGFSMALLTFSKTVLYWLNEAFSGFDNIGHNTWSQLVWLWIIPNGAWLVLPLYMIWVFGAEIAEGLAVAAGKAKRS